MTEFHIFYPVNSSSPREYYLVNIQVAISKYPSGHTRLSTYTHSYQKKYHREGLTNINWYKGSFTENPASAVRKRSPFPT